jgi:hypothetical protein
MMNFQLRYLINSIFCWSIVALAAAGYFLTLKRIGQKWPFWVVLSAGWALIAISNSIVASGINFGESYLQAMWLSSYVLVFASLTLLFAKVIEIRKVKK